MNEIATAAVDDLTEQTCAVCGTPFELTRPNAVVVDGRAYGIVVCVTCEQRPTVRLVTGAR